MNTFRLLPPALALAILTSCGGGSSRAAVTVSAAARQEARQLFDSLCFTCHGNTGHGDGPGAAALEPKPRSFSDKAWQTSVTDEQIVKTITLGGAAVGKSAAMPAQPQLKPKPDVLQALVEIVRAFGK